MRRAAGCRMRNGMVHFGGRLCQTGNPDGGAAAEAVRLRSSPLRLKLHGFGCVPEMPAT